MMIYESDKNIARDVAGVGWNVNASNEPLLLGGLHDATAAVVEEAVAAVEAHGADPARGGAVLSLEDIAKASGGQVPSPVAVLAIKGELKAVGCICGGPCEHMVVTCLDCPESVKVVMPYSNVAAFERKHMTKHIAHAVIVTHTAPSSDGLAGRRITIMQ